MGELRNRDTSVVPGDDDVTWRHDIDALAFRPDGHHGTCVIHRLAFRTLMRIMPTPDACIAYFAAHEDAFHASARAKIGRKRLQPDANFHLTSRDLARTIDGRKMTSSAL
jgi:hypothetical protein